MKPYHTILVVLFVSIFMSCSKLPIYQSKAPISSDNKDFPEIISYQNSKHNDITYGVANTDTNLYLKVIFHDQQNLVKIVRGGGFTIYFDASGKKKKDNQLKIERSDYQAMAMNNMGRQHNSSRENMQENMPSIIARVFDKVTWNANGQELVFNRTVLKDPIKMELVTNDINELVLEVKMPLKELHLPDEQKYFSIGFATNTISAGMGGRPNGGMRSGNEQHRGGFGAGGGQHPGGAGGNAGGKSGRPSNTSTNSSMALTPINIWFEVEL